MATVALPTSALPYVAWSAASFAVVPEDEWELVYGYMQAYKGHVQEYPGCQRFEAFAEPQADGAMRVHTYTTWDTPEQLEAFLDRGYTFERMLADTAGLTVETTRAMEKIF
jgi:heme-degrading monooxygenase HmoA